MINYYCDNSKFPDTIVYYTKHTNTLAHRAILELKIYASYHNLYRNN